MSGFFRKDGKPAAQSALQAAQQQEQPQQQQEQPDKSTCTAQQPDSDSGPEARMDAILAIAAEVSAGMLYLHARSIVHGDLTGANVLFQECKVSLSTLSCVFHRSACTSRAVNWLCCHDLVFEVVCDVRISSMSRCFCLRPEQAREKTLVSIYPLKREGQLALL